MGMFGFDDDVQELKIRKHLGEQFGDSPKEHRWRAWWDHDSKGNVIGIELACYPVVKATAAGAWVDPDAYHHGEWALSGRKRWVSDDGGAAWAKRTQAEALASLAIRHERWGNRLRRDIGHFMSASAALTRLLPKHARHAVPNARAVARHATELAANVDPLCGR